MRLVQWGAIIAVLIAAIGIFGMARLIVSARTKEIGVRKAIGARASDVVALLSQDLARSVLIASAIALPASYWAISEWLAGFAFRIELGPAPFVAGALIATAVGVAASGYETLKAASTNVVNALRYE